MSTQEFFRFQQNLKKSAIGVRFGKKLLTDPKSLSPKQITAYLKLMGLPISRDFEVAQDAAQALILGQATIKQAQAGADIGQLVKPSVSAISTLTRLGNEFGLVDNRTASQVSVLGDACLIFASGGADVGAWIRVGMAVMAESGRADAEATQKAAIQAFSQVSKAQKTQADRFMKNLEELQKGELGIFSFLAENAQDAPLLFDNLIANNPAFDAVHTLFPGLKFFPKVTYFWQGSGSSQTFWGENRDKVHTIELQGLKKMRDFEAADFLVKTTMGPAMEFYQEMRSFFLNAGKADIFNIAPLALFQEKFKIGKNSDLIDKFVRLRLSPIDLGIQDTFKGASKIGQYKSVTSSFGLSKTEVYLTEAQMEAFDRAGNLKPLIYDREARAALEKKFSFDIPVGVNSPLSAFQWDDFSNFIAILDFADFIANDPKYYSLKQQSSWLKFLDSFPKIQEFKYRYQACFELSSMRRVNEAAKVNASNFLGVKPSQLNYNVVEGQPTIFK